MGQSLMLIFVTYLKNCWRRSIHPFAGNIFIYGCSKHDIMIAIFKKTVIRPSWFGDIYQNTHLRLTNSVKYPNPFETIICIILYKVTNDWYNSEYQSFCTKCLFTVLYIISFYHSLVNAIYVQEKKTAKVCRQSSVKLCFNCSYNHLFEAEEQK